MLNWNALQVISSNGELVAHHLSGSDYAAERGAVVKALVPVDTIPTRLNFNTGFAFDTLHGWDELMFLAAEEKIAMLCDPAGRAEMDGLAQIGPNATRANWAAYQLVETFQDEYRRFVGATIGEIAVALDKTPWDALADLVVADKLLTVIMLKDPGQDDASWKARLEAWRDPRTMVGASDAGAHLNMIDSFGMYTCLLGEAVRRRGLLPLEEAVQLITGAPAEYYGLRGRGRIAPGYWADLVLFDPDTIGGLPVTTQFDLPGDAGRLTGGATGVEHVFVRGIEAVSGGTFTDARPGQILRSGRDRATVTVG